MNIIEKTVLSGICQFGEDALIDVSDIISTESFVDQKNQIFFKILTSIIADNKVVDVPTIYSYSKGFGLESFVDKNAAYLNELIQEKTELKNIRQHAKSLMKLHLIRRASIKHKQAYEELQKLTGNETVDEILSVSESPILDLMDESFDEQKPKQIAEDWEAYLDSKINSSRDMMGMPTPFSKFNTVIGGGLRSGGVTLIAARPKTGKSSVGKEIGLHLAQKGIPVLFVDTEMIKDEQLDRCIAGMTGISLTDVENGGYRGDEKEINKVKKALNKLKEIPFYHKEVYGKPFEEILSVIRRWILKDVGFNEDGKIKDCLVIYDYFKLMSDEKLEKMQEYQALGFQVSQLTDFCKEYQFPCLSFVQINRDGINKESSDIIAQSDRLLWLCLSVSIFKRKTEEEMADSGEYGNMKLIPLESRFGPGLEPGDYINLFFDKDKSIITEGETFFSIKSKKKQEEAVHYEENENWGD